MTKNSRPRSPSWISTFPSRTSSWSAMLAIRCSSCFEQCAKSGASLSSCIFWFAPSAMPDSYPVAGACASREHHRV
jgi:hypothetical protein